MSKTIDTNVQTLSQAIELATKVVENVAGDAISNTINGEVATGKEIQRTVAAKLQGAFLTAGDKK